MHSISAFVSIYAKSSAQSNSRPRDVIAQMHGTRIFLTVCLHAAEGRWPISVLCSQWFVRDPSRLQDDIRHLSPIEKDRVWRMCDVKGEREGLVRHLCPRPCMHVTADAVHVLMPW